MTPYQRGCRDALLDLAAQLDKRAGLYKARAATTERSRGFLLGRANIIRMHADDLHAEAVTRLASDLARTLAERAPDDPEEPTP